jgi:hypothetical protein
MLKQSENIKKLFLIKKILIFFNVIEQSLQSTPSLVYITTKTLCNHHPNITTNVDIIQPPSYLKIFESKIDLRYKSARYRVEPSCLSGFYNLSYYTIINFNTQCKL